MPILHNSTSGIVGFYQIITVLGTPRSFIDHVYENPGLEMENLQFIDFVPRESIGFSH